ncbi:MAG: hypothetical protein ISS47_00475 [Candidatus Omnitrophica bacterium]|nr:hypothetical protein [Candidatus Omnitrophota bacterium]
MKRVEKSNIDKIAIAGIIFFGVFGFLLRIYKLPTILNTECWDATNAIRLHYLPFFNFGETIRFNFFKSFLMGYHGITDFLYVYLVTGVYDLLHIPISEHYIYLSHSVLGMVLILCSAFFAFRMFGRNKLIALFVTIFGVLNLDHIVVMSRTNCFFSSEKLLELLTYIAVFYRNDSKKKLIWNVLLSGLLFLDVLTPNIAILPIVLLLQFILYLEKKESPWFISVKGFIKSLLNFREVIIWIPCFFGLIIDYFVQKTIGVSGLGLFGHLLRDYGFNPAVNLIKGLSIAKYLFTVIPDYFYNVLMVFSILGGTICFLRGKLFNFGKRYLFFLSLLLLHLSAELFFGRLWLYDIFIPIIVLGGVGLYYTLHTLAEEGKTKKLLKNSYYVLVFFVAALVILTSIDRLNLASRRNKGLNLVPWLPSFNSTAYTGFDTLYNIINPLKTVGYYLRKNSLKDDKIYLLFGGGARIGSCEYYFGKKAMCTESGTNKQIFDNSHSLEFYKQRDGVDIFDFYIVVESLGYNDYYKSILMDAQKKGVKKVADISYQGKIYASIYSPKKLAYQVLRMEDYDRKWDKEYANLKNIYENKLVGLVTMWGMF